MGQLDLKLKEREAGIEQCHIKIATCSAQKDALDDSNREITLLKMEVLYASYYALDILKF